MLDENLKEKEEQVFDFAGQDFEEKDPREKGRDENGKLLLLPIGGISRVSQNMYYYEYDGEILLVDCGLGFPDQYMPGVDILIPDISYLQDQVTAGKKIVGMLLTHGHDDHIGALPYILPGLPDFPIYASALTAGFAEHRILDGGLTRDIRVTKDREPFQLGRYFSVRSVPMTHSVPDTRHFFIKTPIGNMYHGSDFKLDETPVDGVKPDYEFIEEVSREEGVYCMLSDSLRVEKQEWGPSESTVGPEIRKLMEATEGKFIVTLMSSHIHRIQQVINAAQDLGRRIVFVGRSVEQNVRVASQLDKLHYPQGLIVDKKDIANYADDKLVIVIAGSQGQEGSSLMRAIAGEHPEIQIKVGDKVVFSADAIPGNELNFFGAIDDLSLNGVDTVYPTINSNIHHSGHATAAEQKKLLELVKPQYVMPIGGNNRHRFKYIEYVAEPAGMKAEQVLIPDDGEVLSFAEKGKVRVFDQVYLRPQYVDGLGIGDVGPTVLSDRRALSQAGMIIVVLKRRKGKIDWSDVRVISRGFVYIRDAGEVIEFIKRKVREIAEGERKRKWNDKDWEAMLERKLARSLYKVIQREPMIEVEVVDF